MTKIATSAAVAAVLALSALQANAQDRYDRRFELVNNTDRVIYSVYVPHVGTPRRGPDVLGNNVLHPGESMVLAPVRPEGYCRFDVRVVYDNANGPIQTLRGVNLCDIWELVAQGERRNGYRLYSI